jgi:hypothetical protein
MRINMSRPKGSLNKKTLLKNNKNIKQKKTEVKRKVGRPKNVEVVKEVKVEYVPKTIISKFFGFCKCNSIIGDKDCHDNKYVCPKCGKTGLINSLIKEIKKESAPISKKEYLDGSLNIENMDVPSYNNEINPKDFKIQYD